MGAQAMAKHFKILTYEQLTAPGNDPVYLIDGFLIQDSLAQVYGDPESFKTFLALNAGCSVATGKPFLDREVLRQGDVVYVYGEGGHGIGKRLRAWAAYHKCEPVRFFGINEPVDMLSTEPARVIADIKAAGISPVLIVVDTLARCFGDGDENNTKDMNRFVRGCDALRGAFSDCTVLVVHHCGWQGDRGRGARAWQGALDTDASSKREAGNFTTLMIKKQKDFAKPDKGIVLVYSTCRGQAAPFSVSRIGRRCVRQGRKRR